MEDKKRQGRRLWDAWRDAIEAYVKAVEENKRGQWIHCLARLVRVREKDLSDFEGDK